MPNCTCTWCEAKRREKRRPGILARYTRLVAWALVRDTPEATQREHLRNLTQESEDAPGGYR